MLDEIESVVEENGALDNFGFIGIDTNQDDLYEEAPDRTRPIELDEPSDQKWETHKNEYSYLNPEFTLGNYQGVSRNRPLARYHIDSSENYADVDESLEEHISDFKSSFRDGSGADQIDIWVLNSLGGGTGSGSFLLITAMARNAASRIQGASFSIGGVGSLPRLDNLPNLSMPPKARSTFFANAYTAIRELQEVNDFTKTNHSWSSPSILLENDVSLDDAIDWDGNLFDMYLMTGFRESEKEESSGQNRPYRRQMNRIVANSIYYVANKSMDNFPDTNKMSGEKLFAVNGVELRAPAEEAREFVELQSKIDSLDTDIEELDEEITGHEETIDFLREVERLDLQPDSPPTAEDLEHISIDLIDRIYSKHTIFSPRGALQDVDADPEVDVEAIEKVLEENIEEILDDPSAEMPDPEPIPDFDADDPEENLIREFDESDIVQRFFCGLVEQSVEQTIIEHDFKHRVNKVWNEYNAEIREHMETPDQFEYLDSRSAEVRWESELKQFLSELGQQKKSAFDNTMWPVKRLRLKREVEEIKTHYKKINSLYAEFEKYEALREKSARWKEAARQSIKQDESYIDNEVIEDQRDQKSTKQNKLRTHRENLGRRRDQITTPKRAGGDYRLPLKDIENLERSHVDDDSSIASLVADGFIDEATVANELNSLLNNEAALFGDPVQDQPQRDPTNTSKLLCILTHPDNRGTEEVDNLLDLPLEGGMDIGNRINTEADEREETIAVSEGHSIRFLSLFAPLSFENTSEFGVINEDYLDTTKNVSEHLGPDCTDGVVIRKHAYPELFPDDDRVQDYYQNN